MGTAIQNLFAKSGTYPTGLSGWEHGQTPDSAKILNGYVDDNGTCRIKPSPEQVMADLKLKAETAQRFLDHPNVKIYKTTEEFEAATRDSRMAGQAKRACESTASILSTQGLEDLAVCTHHTASIIAYEGLLTIPSALVATAAIVPEAIDQLPTIVGKESFSGKDFGHYMFPALEKTHNIYDQALEGIGLHIPQHINEADDIIGGTVSVGVGITTIGGLFSKLPKAAQYTAGITEAGSGALIFLGDAVQTVRDTIDRRLNGGTQTAPNRGMQPARVPARTPGKMFKF